MNVVRWWSSSRISPCDSSIVFLVREGKSVVWWYRDWVWFVTRTAGLLSTCMSLVQHGLMFFFRAVTIQWHQITRSPNWNSLQNPEHNISVSIDAFTSCCLCSRQERFLDSNRLGIGIDMRANRGPSFRRSVECV